jgi:hypothetical protein
MEQTIADSQFGDNRAKHSSKPDLDERIGDKALTEIRAGSQDSGVLTYNAVFKHDGPKVEIAAGGNVRMADDTLLE